MVGASYKQGSRAERACLARYVHTAAEAKRFRSTFPVRERCLCSVLFLLRSSRLTRPAFAKKKSYMGIGQQLVTQNFRWDVSTPAPDSRDYTRKGRTSRKLSTQERHEFLYSQTSTVNSTALQCASQDPRGTHHTSEAPTTRARELERRQNQRQQASQQAAL